MAEATILLERVESLIERLETIAHKAEEDGAWSSAAAAIREIRGCLTLLAQLTGELHRGASFNINLSVVSQRVQASLLQASPLEFGRFWKELLEAASQEQKSAALAVIPRGDRVDLSVLTDEELDILERLSKMVRR